MRVHLYDLHERVKPRLYGSLADSVIHDRGTSASHETFSGNECEEGLCRTANGAANARTRRMWRGAATAVNGCNGSR